MPYLSLLGLGFDAGGGVLLVLAILGDPRELSKVAATYWDFNWRSLLERLSNRARGWIALPTIALGGVFQGFGAVASGRQSSGEMVALIAVGWFVLGFVVPFVAWTVISRPLMRFGLRRVLTGERPEEWLPQVAYCCGRIWPKSTAGLGITGDDPVTDEAARTIVHRALGIELSA